MIFYQICLSWHCYDAKLLCLFWYVPWRETKHYPCSDQAWNKPALGSLSMTHVSMYHLRKKKSQSATRVIGACSTIDISPYIPVLVEHECNKMEGYSSSSWFLLYLSKFTQKVINCTFCANMYNIYQFYVSTMWTYKNFILFLTGKL